MALRLGKRDVAREFRVRDTIRAAETRNMSRTSGEKMNAEAGSC